MSLVPARDDAAQPAVAGTQSIFRALSILRAFSSRQPELSGPEVAAKFGYSVPTAYRLLRALEAEQFLVFDHPGAVGRSHSAQQDPASDLTVREHRPGSSARQ